MYHNGRIYFAMAIEINCSGNLHDGILWGDVQPQLTTAAAHNPQFINGFANNAEAAYQCYFSADAYMPTLAASTENDVALVYNYSSSSVFPSIVYSGRMAADAPGTMGQGNSFFVLGGTKSNDSTRWGDYSACALFTNLVSRGIIYCGGEYGGPHAGLGSKGWDTYLYALRME
jgi:hypothetical protein